MEDVSPSAIPTHFLSQGARSAAAEGNGPSAGVRSGFSGLEGERCSLGTGFAVPQPVFGISSVGISSVMTLSLLVPSVQNKRSSRG